MSRPTSLIDLPAVFEAAAPELSSLPWPEEPLTDCANCHLETPPERDQGKPWQFVPGMRCCSFHPNLPNFLVGRALRRGDAGTRQVRARLRDPEGVTAWGVRHGPGWRKIWRDGGQHEGFGRNRAARCPYWVEGPLSCSIWRDREAVCRSWFCKMEQGPRSARFWYGARDLLAVMMNALAERCAQELGEAPKDPAGWEAWFIACADFVDRMDPQELAAQLPDFAQEREDLAQVAVAPPRRMPEVVHSGFRFMRWGQDGSVVLGGYSDYDVFETDPTVFRFIARLDGQKTWKQALHEARIDGITIDEQGVAELFRKAIVLTEAEAMGRDPDEQAPTPGAEAPGPAAD